MPPLWLDWRLHPLLLEDRSYSQELREAFHSLKQDHGGTGLPEQAPKSYTVKKNGPGRREGQPLGTEGGFPVGVQQPDFLWSCSEPRSLETRIQDISWPWAFRVRDPSWRRLLLGEIPRESFWQSETSPTPLAWLLTHCQDHRSQQGEQGGRSEKWGKVALLSSRAAPEQDTALQAARPFRFPLGFSSQSLPLPSFLDCRSICIFLFFPLFPLSWGYPYTYSQSNRGAEYSQSQSPFWISIATVFRNRASQMPGRQGIHH